MKKLLYIFQSAALVLILLTPELKADNTTATVGGQSITIPAPNNFFQVYGKSSNYDAYANGSVPKSNKMLAVFMDENSSKGSVRALRQKQAPIPV